MMMKAPFRSNTIRLGKGGILLGMFFVVVLVALFLGPTIRDVVVSLLSSVPNEQALLPRSTILSRLASAEVELSRTRYQSLLYQSLEEQVRQLERELKLKPYASYGAARVLSAPPRTHYDTLLIDTGSEDGVLMGDSASVEGFAVGSVTEVSQHSALIQLYSSPGSTHDAFIGDEKGITVVQGTGGGSLEALVPGDVPVEMGDVVRDARTGYIFGVVVSVKRRETDTEQYLSVTLPDPPSSIRTVSLTHAP